MHRHAGQHTHAHTCTGMWANTHMHTQIDNIAKMDRKVEGGTREWIRGGQEWGECQ